MIYMSRGPLAGWMSWVELPITLAAWCYRSLHSPLLWSSSPLWMWNFHWFRIGGCVTVNLNQYYKFLSSSCQLCFRNAPYPWAAVQVGLVPVETREDSILWVLASWDVAHYLWVSGPLECSCQSKKHAMWRCSGALQASNDYGSIPWHGNWPQAKV